MSASRAHERSVTRLLRAYPPRYLDVRRAELVDLLDELAGPAADRLPWRTRLDLVRGGLEVRWRDRPPLVDRLRYRWFETRLEPRWALWVRDDIASPTYVARRVLLAVSPALLGGAVSSKLTGAEVPVSAVAVYVAVLLMVLMLGRGRLRRRARKRHGITAHGALQPEPAPSFRWIEAPRPVRQAWPTLLTVGLIGPIAASCVAAVLHAAPLERAYLGGSLSVEDTTGVGAVAPYVLVAGMVLGLLALVVVPRRVGAGLRGRTLEQAVPVRQAEPARPLRTAVIAVAIIAATVAGGWLLLLPPVYAVALIAAGACTGPSFVVTALLARRAEQRSGMVVPLAELVQALAGRPVVGQPRVVRRVVPVPPG